MKRAPRIIECLKIIGIFAGLTLLISFVWLLVEIFCFRDTSFRADGVTIALYLLGYGDVNEGNAAIKLTLSFVSILGIAILSSVFTVRLFEWQNRAAISEKMIIGTPGGTTPHLYALVEAGKHDLYKLSVSLCISLSSGGVIYAEEKTFPFLAKGDSIPCDYAIDAGGDLYDFFRRVIRYGEEKVFLTLFSSYVDSGNSQEHTVCSKYEWDKKTGHIVANNGIKEGVRYSLKQFALIAARSDNSYDAYFEKYIKSDGIPINMSHAAPINGEFISIEHGRTPATLREYINVETNMNIFTTNVDLSKAQVGDDSKGYTMVVIREPLSGNWVNYYNKNYAIEFDLYVSEGIVVTLEIKGKNGNHIFIDKNGQVPNKFNFSSTSGEYKHFSFELQEAEQEYWKCVKEICFTVFKSKTTTSIGEFSVIGCELVQK